MKKIISSIALLAAGTLLLAGCAGSPSASKAGALSTPKNFTSVSNSNGHFEFTSLSGGKNSVDFKTVCNDLFAWAKENKFTRYTLIDNTFQLGDYDNQGRPISKNEADDSPWISACGSNLERLTETGDNASPEGPNKNKIAVFFGRFDEGDNKIVGNAWLSAAWEGKTKYVTLSGDFLDPTVPVEKAVSSPSGGESPKPNN